MAGHLCETQLHLHVQAAKLALNSWVNMARLYAVKNCKFPLLKILSLFFLHGKGFQSDQHIPSDAAQLKHIDGGGFAPACVY